MSVTIKFRDLTMSESTFEHAKASFGEAITQVVKFRSNGDVVARVGHRFESEDELLSFVRTALRDDRIQLLIDL